MLKAIGKPKVGYDNIAISVEEQVLELEISVDDLLGVDVGDARDELCKEFARVLFFEVSVGKDMVE